MKSFAFFRTKIALNDAVHFVGGHSIIGEPTTNYYTHNVFSLLKMNSGDTASLWGFSLTDPGPKRVVWNQVIHQGKNFGTLKSRNPETENFQEGNKKDCSDTTSSCVFFRRNKQTLHVFGFFSLPKKHPAG